MKLLTSISKLFKSKGNFPHPRGKTEELGETEIRSFPNGINISRFYDNLLATQHYCEQQLIQFPEKPVGSILRSYNTESNRSLFDFKEIENCGKKFSFACWIAG